MANFSSQRKETTVSIPYVERDNKVTLYVISVEVGSVKWQVKHRYSLFSSLHDALVSEHGVAKEILPPKKVIGNQDPEFIEKRRLALETYLRTVFNFLQRTMPQELVHFLKFQNYDILFILQEMSVKFFQEGDFLLQKNKSYKLSPLEMYAISERLKQPCPPIDTLDKRYDFSHVLDFCCQLIKLEIKGSCLPYNSSNIILNELLYDFLAFKSLHHLILDDVSAEKISNALSLRLNLTSLAVTHSNVTSIVEIVMCDALHKDCKNAGVEYIWHQLKELDLSHNSVQEIDDSVKLMPHLSRLNMSHNKMSCIRNLTHSPHLSHLILAANSIRAVENLHLKLGNIVHLDLSENRITSLSGFSRLFSLEHLELACNAVTDVAEARHLAALPNLESLTLTGNPVASSVDYRVRVLERIGKRASNVCLDNEGPSQKEMDTIAVLQALRVVQESRSQTHCSNNASCP